MEVEEIAETAVVTKENAALKEVQTVEIIVQATVPLDANASAANAQKDASVSATIEQALIEEAVAVSVEMITAVAVAQAEALDQVDVHLVADTANQKRAVVTQKGNQTALEEAAEVSSRKLTLDSKD